MAKDLSTTQGWLHNQVGLRVSDLENSISFYEAVLGMQVLGRISGDNLSFALLAYSERGGPEKMLNREGVLELSTSEVRCPTVASPFKASWW